MSNYQYHTIPKDLWKCLTIKKENNNMNYTKAILLIDDNVKVVKVNYEAGSQDKYFKTLDNSLTKEDFVVIPTNTRHNMTVGKIIEIDCLVNLDDADQIGWIVQRVNKTDYDNTLKQESVAVDQIKSAEIRKKKSDLLDAIKVDRAAISGMLPSPTSITPATSTPPAQTA